MVSALNMGTSLADKKAACGLARRALSRKRRVGTNAGSVPDALALAVHPRERVDDLDRLGRNPLAEDAFAVAGRSLKPGGAFLAKVFQGGAEGALLAELKRAFAELRHAKPPASRAESAETYVVATGFRGGA